MEIRSNFKKGSVEMLILMLLYDEPMYGYQLSQSILERSDGIINIPEGSLYPTLYKLLDNSYVSDERRLVGKRMSRIYYSITTSGVERLKTLYAEYLLVQQGVQKIFDTSKLNWEEINNEG